MVVVVVVARCRQRVRVHHCCVGLLRRGRMVLERRRLVHLGGARVPVAACGGMMVHVHVHGRLDATGKLRGIASEPSSDPACDVGIVALGRRQGLVVALGGGHVGLGGGGGGVVEGVEVALEIEGIIDVLWISRHEGGRVHSTVDFHCG